MEKKQCKVQVVIRLRPLLAIKDTSCVSTTEHHVEIFNHRNVKENLQYE